MMQSLEDHNDFGALQVEGCLGGAVVWRQTRDQNVAGSTPDHGAIKSTNIGQLSLPSLRGR